MKKCSKCKTTYSDEEFYKDNTKKTGLSSHCKKCIKWYRKENYLLNSLKKINSSSEYYKKNKDKIRIRKKKHYSDNKEKLLIKQKKYYKENKDKRSEYSRMYVNRRRNKDKLFRLKNNIGSLIRISIKQRGFSKKSKTSKILGCNYQELMNHLNSNKYGFKFADDNIDLDHIIPLSSAKTEERLLELNHYTNLQLLPSYYNRHIKKDNIFNKKEFEKWLKNN